MNVLLKHILVYHKKRTINLVVHLYEVFLIPFQFHAYEECLTFAMHAKFPFMFFSRGQMFLLCNIKDKIKHLKLYITGDKKSKDLVH